jgi:hypothetical protein
MGKRESPQLRGEAINPVMKGQIVEIEHKYSSALAAAGALNETLPPSALYERVAQKRQTPGISTSASTRSISLGVASLLAGGGGDGGFEERVQLTQAHIVIYTYIYIYVVELDHRSDSEVGMYR